MDSGPHPPTEHDAHQGTADPRKRKPARQLISAACEECRRRKVKCDGARPQCNRCCKHGDACLYTVGDGETRQAALKSRVQSMEKDFDSMVGLLASLHTASAHDANDLLSGLRASPDVSTFLQTLQSPMTNGSSPLSPDIQRSLRDQSIFLGQRLDTEQRLILGQPYPPSELPPEMQHRGTLLGSNETTAQNLGTFTFHADFPGLPPEILIPDENSLRQAVEIFFLCCGKLFHVASRRQIEQCFKDVFVNEASSTNILALCNISSMAAVGCQYKGHAADALRENLYRIARTLLDACIEINPIRAVQCCTLFSMYNIMDHATIAMVYTELGLSLCKRNGIQNVYHPPGLPQNDWIDGKRSLRTLLFLNSWLASTFGYSGINEWTAIGKDSRVTETPGECGMDDIVQIEMFRIAVLKQDIMRISSSFAQLSVLSIEETSRGIRSWHAELPPLMQLSTLIGASGSDMLTKELRRAIFFVHLLYLGVWMLLYRRIVAQCNSPSAGNSLGSSMTLDVDSYAQEAILAAKQSSRILALLQEGNSLFEHCWLCIFQAYSSCTFILHQIARDLPKYGEGFLISEDFEQARKCLNVLRFCSNYDTAAAKFLGALRPVYNDLQQVYQSHDSSGLPPVAAKLYTLIHSPLGYASDPMFDLSNGLKHSPSAAPVQLNHLSPDTNWTDVDGVKDDGTIKTVLSGSRPTHFPEKFWQNNHDTN